MVRWVGWAAFVSLVLVACYSGLGGNEPFPCAADKTCPSPYVCDPTSASPTCATSCPSGLTACGGTCVDTSSDTSNCGSCGNTCMAGASCKGSSCSCGSLANCNNACVNLSTDNNNCGMCGRSCGGTCTSGKCPPVCTLFGSDCTGGGICALEGLSSTLWSTACRTPGSAKIGEPCLHGNDCAAGLECLLENNIGWCWQLCDNAHPCPGGATCHGNLNIPNGGGYCTTSSVCGTQTNTVPCSGPSGSYTCPPNSFCNPSTSHPTECTCSSGFSGYTCTGQSCGSATCQGNNWWCD